MLTPNQSTVRWKLKFILAKLKELDEPFAELHKACLIENDDTAKMVKGAKLEVGSAIRYLGTITKQHEKKQNALDHPK